MDAMVTNRNGAVSYEPMDWNRVESAVRELAGRLNAAGHNITITVKTNWAISDVPTLADMERYRANIITIRAALAMLSTTPATPASMRDLTWQQANDIEKILQDVESLLNKMATSFVPCGDAISGGDYL